MKLPLLCVLASSVVLLAQPVNSAQNKTIAQLINTDTVFSAYTVLAENNHAMSVAPTAPSGPMLLPHQHGKTSGKNCWRKPGADISIVSREFVGLNPGEIKDFSVDLLAADQTGQLTIELQPEKGLQLLSGQQHFVFNLADSSAITLPVQLRAAQAGSWVLNVIATITDAEGHASSRALALIVQVGNLMNTSGQQKGQSSKTAEGDVVVMPATEIIR